MKIRERLYSRFMWFPHNVLAHPLSEIMFQLGFPEKAYNWVHDITIPDHERGTGRG